MPCNLAKIGFDIFQIESYVVIFQPELADLGIVTTFQVPGIISSDETGESEFP